MTDTPGAGDDEIRALAIQADGRIVAAGRSGNRIGVARYAPGGTQEPAFARVHDFAGVTEERANGVVVEPDGRILLAGTGVVDGDRRFLLAALTPDGAIDATFGAGGLVTLDVGDGEAAVRSVERQPDGKLLVAGTTDGAGTGGGVVARFLPDGTPDIGFSTDGIARVGVPGVIVEDVALQPDGKVVAVGAVDAATATSDSLVARFRPGGVRDPGFGVDGVVRRSLGPAGPDGLTGVGVAAGGGIVAGGLASGPDPSIVLAGLTGGDSSDPALAMTAGSLGDLVAFTDHGDESRRRPGPGRQRHRRASRRRRGDRAHDRGRRLHRHLVLARHRAAGRHAADDAAGARAGARPAERERAAHRRDVRRQPRQQLGQRDGHGHRQSRRPPRPHQAEARAPAARAAHQAGAQARAAGRQDERGRDRRRPHALDGQGKTRTFAKTRTVKLRKKGAKTVRLTLTRAGRKAAKRKRTRAPGAEREGPRPRQGGQQAHRHAAQDPAPPKLLRC